MKDDIRDERWEVVEDPERCTMICMAGEDGDTLAEMTVYASKNPDLNDARQSARARLMAAAPHMLEALGRIAGHTDPDAPEENYRSDDPEGCMDTVFSIARAAIARANGEAT